MNFLCGFHVKCRFELEEAEFVEEVTGASNVIEHGAAVVADGKSMWVLKTEERYLKFLSEVQITFIEDFDDFIE